MKKFFKWVVIIVFVLVLVLVIARNQIIKSAVTRGVKAAVGMDLTLQSLDLGILKTALELKGLVVQNPPGFGGGVLIDVPEVLVDYVLKSFLGGKACFTRIELYVKEINVIRNEAGELNVEAFGKPGEGGKPAAARKEKEGEAKASAKFRIDLLKLRIDKATFTDLASGEAESYDLGIDEEFKNITDAGDIIRVVMISALQNNLFRRATGLDLNDFSRQLGSENLEGLSRELEGMGKEATGLLQSIFGGE